MPKSPNLKAVLASPRVYQLLQWMLGGTKARIIFAEQYVRAKPGDRILDIGCGPADLLQYLPRVTYIGFDVSADYIAHARKRYGSRGHFYCEHVSQASVQNEEPFDVVLASAILHHLSDPEALDLFELAKSFLTPGGRLVTLDPVFVEKQSPVARYLIRNDRGEYVRWPEAYEALAKQVFPNVKTSIRNDLITFPYTHIIMECLQ